MLSPQEVRRQAEYCTCVLLQLGWMAGNPSIPPARYPELLKRSSLKLGDDPFITMTVEEALMMGQPDGGVTGLVHFYEGLVHALCQVLETDAESIEQEIPLEFLKKLAEEVFFDLPGELGIPSGDR
ncbi:MAG: hypothetical protein GX443_07180 [Deltaproteobacteria bacterium]|nr:hypothetical protein [Deltaproteobacteria bacterium]